MRIILKFFAKIAHKWWCFWSNFRFRKMERFDKSILEEDKVQTVNEIKNLCKKLYKKFTYTQDDITQLYDAILPSPQAYKNYLKGELKEDCDGFHSLVLHCLKCNNIESYLLSVNAGFGGHCVLIFKHNNIWYVIDYDTIYSGSEDLSDIIDRYNDEYVKVYKEKHKVYNNCLIDYNYEKGKFKLTSVKKISR